jgi:hypothetical protein
MQRRFHFSPRCRARDLRPLKPCAARSFTRQSGIQTTLNRSLFRLFTTKSMALWAMAL